MDYGAANVGDEEAEDAVGKALMQQLPRKQPCQAAVLLEQLLMQPPTQGTSNFFFS